MKINKLKTISFFLLVLGSFNQCNKQPYIIGKWFLHKASENNREHIYRECTFIEFKENNTYKMAGVLESKGKWSLKKNNQLVIDDIYFDLIKLTKDSLIYLDKETTVFFTKKWLEKPN